MKATWGRIVLVAVGLGPVTAQAEPSAAPSSGTAAPSSSSSESSSLGPSVTPRRDPDGLRGISPSREAVLRGDRATVAHDLEAARREYQGAITFAPSDPLGQLRTAELALMQKDLPLASEASAAAVRYSQEDVQRARALYLEALVREAEGDLTRAAAAWLAYRKLAPPEAAAAGSSPTPATTAASSASGASPPAEAAPNVTPHLATALARAKVVEERQKLEADYAKVRERMQKELADAQAAQSANAAK